MEFDYKVMGLKMTRIEGSSILLDSIEQDIADVTKRDKGFIPPFLRPKLIAVVPKSTDNQTLFCTGPRLLHISGPLAFKSHTMQPW